MNISEITVVGAGTMGSGIAAAAAACGFAVNLVDVNEEVLRRGKSGIEAGYAKSVEKGKMSAADQAAALARLKFSRELSAASSGLAIEAVTENADVKRKVFARLAETAPGSAILASNTSALRISDFASAVRDQGRVIGLHFFNPVHAMKLVEIVQTPATSEATVAAAREFVARLGKTPVLVRESPGFIVNRLLIPMINEAAAIWGEKTASAEDIDQAMMLGANHPIGPLALADLVGLDVCLAIMETLAADLGDKYAPAPSLRDLVRQGKLGRKTGQGFHAYKK